MCVCVTRILSSFLTFYVTASTVFRYINGTKLHNKEDTSLGFENLDVRQMSVLPYA